MCRLAWGVPDVDLDPVPAVVDGRVEVRLRGRVRWDYDSLSGYATRGERGALPCRPLSSERAVAPEFALRCPVSAADDMTVIELHASPRGRLLGRRVLRLLVSARGDVPRRYQAPVLALPVGPDDHDDVALVASVTAVAARGPGRAAGPLYPAAPA